MPDLDEPVRQHVQQEPPDELVGSNRHDLKFVVVRVIPPPERDRIVLHLHDPMIADRYPVCVSPEIVKNTFGSIERRFRVDDPFLPVQVGYQGVPRCGLFQSADRAGVDELVLLTKFLQIRDELSLEELRHDFDREEEVFFAGHPLPTSR